MFTRTYYPARYFGVVHTPSLGHFHVGSPKIRSKISLVRSAVECHNTDDSSWLPPGEGEETVRSLGML